MRALFGRNRILSVLCGGVVALWLSGCSTVKEARQIQRDEVPRLPGEYTVKAVDAGLVAGRVLSLSELEDIALRYNPSVLQAELSVSQAQIALSNAKAGYLPTLGMSASHSRSTANKDAHHGSTRNTGSYSGGLNMSLTVFDFGRTSAEVRSAQDSLAAALSEYEAQKNTVVYNVRKAYFELCRATELHAVAVETVSQYKDHLDQVTLKKEIGESIAYDVLKAEVDYQEARLKELTTANDIQLGWTALNLALGLAENPEYSLGDSQVHEYSENAEELMAIACEHEPSLAAMRYEIDSVSASVDAAIAELYPSLSLSLSGNVSGRNPGFPWLWNLAGGLSFSENLFNGGRTMNSIRQSVLSLQMARSRYEASKQSVYSNLRKAVLNANYAKEYLEVAQLSAESAQKNLEIVNEKYKYGKATSVDRTDAQVSYYTARAQAVKARFDYLEAQTAIAILIGD